MAITTGVISTMAVSSRATITFNIDMPPGRLSGVHATEDDVAAPAEREIASKA
jgi:hypothetical protein